MKILHEVKIGGGTLQIIDDGEDGYYVALQAPDGRYDADDGPYNTEEEAREIFEKWLKREEERP